MCMAPHRCPPQCRSQSGADSEYSFRYCLPHPPISWDLGPRHYLLGDNSGVKPVKPTNLRIHPTETASRADTASRTSSGSFGIASLTLPVSGSCCSVKFGLKKRALHRQRLQESVSHKQSVRVSESVSACTSSFCPLGCGRVFPEKICSSACLHRVIADGEHLATSSSWLRP